MKCKAWNRKTFYLTSSELVILQLLGKSTVASITIITVYPESSCSVFFSSYMKWNKDLNHEFYPGKNVLETHFWHGNLALGEIDWMSPSLLFFFLLAPQTISEGSRNSATGTMTWHLPGIRRIARATRYQTQAFWNGTSIPQLTS